MKESSNVKRKKRFPGKLAITIAAAAIAVSGAVSGVTPVLADFDGKSQGNLILKEGEIKVNSADIGTLKEQLEILYREVPDIPRISYEGMTRKNNLKSKGTIDYETGKVVICADDFAYLADEIDLLEAAYKINIVNALNSIDTYFTSDGMIVHDSDAADTSENSALKLSFAGLYKGIVNSQSVEHLEEQQIYAAASDNLSAGTAAWVNGKLIIGNGADNDAFYEKGLEEGKRDMTLVTKVISIMYSHREESERVSLTSDANGFSAAVSGTNDYTGAPAEGHSTEITLIDFTDDDETKLLYEITISGSVSATGLQYGSGYDVGACFYLKDGNGNLIASKSSPALNAYEASYTVSFKLFDYNIDTNQVYLEYFLRPYVNSRDCIDRNTGQEYHTQTVTARASINDYISCTYYLPE